jgi:hypothetical protein
MRAAGASDEEFARIVERHSVHGASRARNGYLTTLDAGEPDDEVEDAISRVGYSMTRPGEVGLVWTSDGQYHVLRAISVERLPRPWDEESSVATRSLIAEERRERILEEFEVRLRADSEIHVYEEVLNDLHVPAWDEYY